MAFRVGRSAEADKYLPGGRNYRGPIFGQQPSVFGQYSPYQRPQQVMSIPTGGFAGQNQIGGQSSINVYRIPPPPLTPEQQRKKDLEDRAKQLRQNSAELELRRREAELEQSRIDAEQIASGNFTIDGRPVSAREMFEVTGNAYQQDYVTPPKVTPQQERQRAIQQSVRQFIQDPMEFIFGGGQNVGEVISYLNQANQLFRLTGQEGNFMDALLGSSLARQGGSTPRPYSGNPMDAPIALQTPGQNNAESASARLARLGIKPQTSTQTPMSIMGQYTRLRNDLLKTPCPPGYTRNRNTGLCEPDDASPNLKPIINSDIVSFDPNTAGEKGRAKAARYEAFLENQRVFDEFERELRKRKGSDDYIYRNLSRAERKDSDMNSTARINARLENRKEIERDLEEFKSLSP